jgi:hypothetical protein
MPRRANRTTPVIVSGRIYTDDAFTGSLVGSSAWFAWLDSATTFYYEGREGIFTAHLERRQRGGSYWIAYRRQHGVLRRCHLGKAYQLTLDRLQAVAGILSTLPNRP